MAEETIKGYRNPGDIEIQTFKLVSVRGQVIDIGPIVVEFNIYQDLFENFLQCDVLINDSIGLIQTLGNGDNDAFGGFTGGELLVVSYRSKDESLKFKNHFFALHQLSDRTRIEEKSEAYALSGISIEAYYSYDKRISKVYGANSGNTIDKMVKSVVDEYIYNDIVRGIYNNFRSILNFKYEKKSVYDATNGLHKFIIPSMDISTTLKFLCDRADNDSHIPYFVFYENNDGFNFKDLNNLVKQDVKEKYTFAPSNYNEGRKTSEEKYFDRTKIMSYNVIRQSSFLANAQQGLFKTKMINLDLLNKKKTEVVFDYTKNSSKFSKLQEKYVIPGSVESDTILYLMTDRSNHTTANPLFRKENHLPKKDNKIIQQRKSFQRHIFNTVLEVTIPGDSEIQVGDVVYLSIPVASNIKSVDNQEDKYLSGKYIITKLRQKMKGKTGDDFVTVFECAKDSRI